MEKVIVLTICGKREDVDTCRVELFNSKEEADTYIAENNIPDSKYFTKCAII